MASVQRSIEEKISTGQHYDAQQMVKTVHRRLCAKGKHAEAAKLCVDSAARFSGAGEHELAVDLGKDLVSSLESCQESPSEENLAQIEAILHAVPKNAATPVKYALMQQALKWSSASCSTGHPRLHRLAATSYWAEGEFGKCQGHFVFCGDGVGLAEMVSEWRQRGYPNERDLFSLRLLLILLSLNDLVTARSFWDAVNAGTKLPGEQAVTTSSAARSDEPEGPARAEGEASVPEPPVQCGTFLLAAAEARSLEFFRMVRGKYALVIRRDATFDKYLDEIELKVFGAQVQRNGFGALFEMLLGGGGGGDVGDGE